MIESTYDTCLLCSTKPLGVVGFQIDDIFHFTQRWFCDRKKWSNRSSNFHDQAMPNWLFSLLLRKKEGCPCDAPNPANISLSQCRLQRCQDRGWRRKQGFVQHETNSSYDIQSMRIASPPKSRLSTLPHSITVVLFFLSFLPCHDMTLHTQPRRRKSFFPINYSRCVRWRRKGR